LVIGRVGFAKGGDHGHLGLAHLEGAQPQTEDEQQQQADN